MNVSDLKPCCKDSDRLTDLKPSSIPIDISRIFWLCVNLSLTKYPYFQSMKQWFNMLKLGPSPTKKASRLYSILFGKGNLQKRNIG